MEKKEIGKIIAKRAAKEFKRGDVVNLGIGIPTLIPQYLAEDISVYFQAESGILGVGPPPARGKEDQHIADAGDQLVTIVPGGMTFDSAYSFSIIRGGHVDVTILGALQLSEKGDLANWMIPGKKIPGMGGAMDLLVGSKRVIIAMEHTARGTHKILKECSLPLTARREVDLIITEKCVMQLTKNGLVLTEVHPQSSIEDIRENTGADFKIHAALKQMLA